MAQAIADILYQNSEVVRKAMPTLFELESYPSQMIKKSVEAHRISRTPNSADFRAPLEYAPAGRFGTFDRAGGSLGTGSGYKTQQLVQTCFPLKLGIELNLDVRWATEAPNLTVVNAFKHNMKRAIPTFQRYEDAGWHNIVSGNQGLIAQSTSYASDVYTMDPEHGADLVQMNQSVEIYDSALTGHRTTGVTPDSLPYVLNVDKANKTVKLSSLSGLSPAAGDYLAFEGAGATPAWMNGLYYFHSTATSGNLLGLSRTTVSEINSNFVDGSAGLSPEIGFQLYAKIKQRRGKVATLQGLVHTAQAATMYKSAIAISEWQRGGNDKMIDLFPKLSDTITWCGVPHRIDIHQSRKRIDWINTKQWGRVWEHELDWYEDLSGRRFFPKRTSDVISAADSMYLVCSHNFYCVDPGGEGFIYDLPIPTGF